MKKSTKLILVLLSIGLLAGTLVWNFVNKPVKDYSKQTASKSFTFDDIMNKVSNDTASLIELKDKLVSIEAKVKNVNQQGESITLELGDTTSMSSIICQVDSRYTSDFKDLKPGSNIAVQGIITGYTIDTDLGLGNTVEMNFCTLKK